MIGSLLLLWLAKHALTPQAVARTRMTVSNPGVLLLWLAILKPKPEPYRLSCTEKWENANFVHFMGPVQWRLLYIDLYWMGTNGAYEMHWRLWARATTWTGRFLTPQYRNIYYSLATLRFNHSSDSLETYTNHAIHQCRSTSSQNNLFYFRWWVWWGNGWGCVHVSF